MDVGPDDVMLLIEVGDTSLDYDREVKLPLYAQAGIPEVWIIDLSGERVEVYRRPGREGYQQAHLVRRGQQVVCEGLPGLVVPVDEIL